MVTCAGYFGEVDGMMRIFGYITAHFAGQEAFHCNSGKTKKNSRKPWRKKPVRPVPVWASVRNSPTWRLSQQGRNGVNHACLRFDLHLEDIAVVGGSDMAGLEE